MSRSCPGHVQVMYRSSQYHLHLKSQGLDLSLTIYQILTIFLKNKPKIAQNWGKYKNFSALSARFGAILKFRDKIYTPEVQPIKIHYEPQIQ